MARPLDGDWDEPLDWDNIAFPPTDPDIYFEKYPGLREWGAHKFGMDVDDMFDVLPKQFNTVTIPLLTQETFCYDVFHVGRTAENKADFYCQLKERRDQRLKELHNLWNEAIDPDEFLQRMLRRRKARGEPFLTGQDYGLMTYLNMIHVEKSLDTYIAYFASNLDVPRYANLYPQPAAQFWAETVPAESPANETSAASLAADQEFWNDSPPYFDTLSGGETSPYKATDEECLPPDEKGSTTKEEKCSSPSESPPSSRYATPPEYPVDSPPLRDLACPLAWQTWEGEESWDKADEKKAKTAAHPPPYRVQKPRQKKKKQSPIRHPRPSSPHKTKHEEALDKIVQELDFQSTESLPPRRTGNTESPPSPEVLELLRELRTQPPEQPRQPVYVGLNTVRGSKISKARKKPKSRGPDAYARLLSVAAPQSLPSAPAPHLSPPPASHLSPPPEAHLPPIPDSSSGSIRRSHRLRAKGRAAAYVHAGEPGGGGGGGGEGRARLGRQQAVSKGRPQAKRKTQQQP